ncbi:F-box/LRR-repeat protein [Glycine soja]|uniref:F-box/LRR-repeat protein n=1 Tax=Glycine soja TaxID=3848 RepID=A0A445KT03_GLYSO|nr:F-box/LRR-repeat protein [Glycine soja]
MSRYLKSRSAETKHLVTPFNTVFTSLVRLSGNLESVSLSVDRALSGVSFEDVEDEADDFYLTDINFIREWLPSVSDALKSFSVSDFWVQSCWRRSEALSLISSTCHNLVKLVVRNAWLSVDGLCLMPTLTYLTLEFVRLDDEDLSRINACFPNLTQLNLIGEPKINLLHLTTCQWSVSNAPLSLIVCEPCLVDFNLRCIKPRLVVLEAPLLSNFSLSLENTDELSTVKRLTLDLVGRTEQVDVAEFGITLLDCFPNITYLNLGPGAWHVMENSFSWGGLKDGIGMKMIKELIAHLVVHEMGYYSHKWLNEDSNRVPPHQDMELTRERLKCFKRFFLDVDVRRKVNIEFANFSDGREDFDNLDSLNDRGQMDPKVWWLVHGINAPILQKIVLKLLAQPCSSSCCERNWSTYSFIHSLKRNKMTPHRAEDLVFVHSDLRLLSRNTPQYHQEETKMWDVAGEDFGSLDDYGILEIASLSLDEPELEGVFFNDDC